MLQHHETGIPLRGPASLEDFRVEDDPVAALHQQVAAVAVVVRGIGI